MDIPLLVSTPQALVPPRADAIGPLPTTHNRQVASCPPVTSKELSCAIAKQVIAPWCPPVPKPSRDSLTVELTRCWRTIPSQYPQLRIDSRLPGETVHTPKHECTRPIVRADIPCVLVSRLGATPATELLGAVLPLKKPIVEVSVSFDASVGGDVVGMRVASWSP